MKLNFVKINSFDFVEWRRVCANTCLFALLFVLWGAAAADEFKIGGAGAALGTMRLLADEFMTRNPDVRITILPSLGSGGGIKAVAAGAIGLAVAARPPDESEGKLGVVATEYARTPFVFAVSVKSKVAVITTAELIDIYSGKMTNWADGSPARVVLRLASDIDTATIKNISPAFRRAVEVAETRPGVRVAVSDQDAADDLERIPGAIGPLTLAQIVSEKRALRAVKLNGNEPVLKNAAAGVYPYYKRLFVVTGAPRAAAVERFVAFVQSPAGLRILAGNGQWIP
jgi:phosphate transport system substrate-binding protein